MSPPSLIHVSVLGHMSLDSAVDRRALVPPSVWPDYTCSERDGSGWEVIIDQVDKRAKAVLVRFVYARDQVGKRYSREWLKLASLTPL